MAKSALGRPSQEYITSLLTDLQKIYAPQDEQIRRMREVREQTRPVEIDKDFRVVNTEVRAAEITDECARVVASLAHNSPRCHVTAPESAGDTGIINSTKREHATVAILQISGRREPGRDTNQAIVDSVVADGGAWAKLVCLSDIWDERYGLRLQAFEKEEQAKDKTETEPEGESNPGASADREAGYVVPTASEDYRSRASRRYRGQVDETKKKSGPPFAFVCADALGVYPVFSGGRLSEMVEVTERPQLAALRQYRLKRDAVGNLQKLLPDEVMQGWAPGTDDTTGSLVRFIEHWDVEWYTLLILSSNYSGQGTGQIALQFRHRYGRVPYFYAPGLTLNHWRNRKVGWGIGEAKRWLVEYKSFLLTLLANVVARDALGPLQRKRTPLTEIGRVAGDVKKETKKKSVERWSLREIIDLEPGDELAPIDFKDVAQSIEKQIMLIDQAIERLSAPRVQGDLTSDIGSGFAIAQLLVEIRTRFDPLAQGIERLYDQVTEFLWYLIEHVIGETVWASQQSEDGGFLSLGPDDLTNAVGVRWELNPERPTDQLVQARYWHERLDKGTAHFDQAIEGLGDNPDEIRRGKAKDRIRAGDAYTKLLDMAVFGQIAKGDMIAQAARAQTVASTGGLPGLQAPAQAMGSPGVPDMGALSISPNGAGAAPVGGGPPNGAVVGGGPGVVLPAAGIAAGTQQLMG